MKKLLSVVLAICVMVSALGAMPAMATTSAVDGETSVVLPSTPSAGGSSGGGGGGSAFGGTSSGISAPAVMDLYSNGIECNSGSFFAGDLALDGYITTIDTEYDVFAVLAQYDNTGALIKTDIRKETVSPADPYIYAALYSVSVVGKVKAMLLRADSLMPIVPSKEYSAYGRSFVIDDYNIGSGVIYYDQVSRIEYYENDTASRTTKAEIAAGATVTVNGTKINYTQFDISAYIRYNSKLRLVENTGDKYFDAVAVTVYEYGIVDEVIPDRERVTFIDGNRLSLDSGDIEQIADIYDADGNRIGLSDIHPGDVLAMVVGDLNYDSYLPVYAKAFSERITIYNLGDNSVTGMVTGLDMDYNLFVIDGVEYRYNYRFITEYNFNDFIQYCGLGTSAKFYLDMDGVIIGYDDSMFDNRGYKYGVILQSLLNSSGFEYCYEVKLLTEDEGIVTYSVDTNCAIDGIKCSVDEQTAIAFGEYDNSVDNPSDRLIAYNTNKLGEISEVSFLGNNTASVDGEYVIGSTHRVGGQYVDNNTFVFYLDCANVDEAFVTNILRLVDGEQYTGYALDEYPDHYNDVFIVQSGELASDSTDTDEPGTEEPDTDEPVYYGVKTGFILQTALNLSGFEPFYQVKVLVENKGVEIYNVATECKIDGVNREISGSYNDEQAEFISFAKYENTDAANAYNRLISYELNTNGEIDSIDFISDSVASAEGKLDAATCTIGDAAIDENAVVFYLDCSDADDCYPMSVADLTDGNKYSVLYVNDEIVLVLEEAICYDGEGCLYVVDSVVKTMYDDDDAYQVSYYTEGEKLLQVAIFTDDSTCVYGDYMDLVKSSLFVAHIAEDGFVKDYAVLANKGSSVQEYDSADMNQAFEATYGEDAYNNDVEFVYGYIYDIDKDEVCVADRWYYVTGCAQYCYNTTGSKPRITVGSYEDEPVDIYNSGEATLAYIKVYYDEATDIITFTDRKTVSQDQVHIPIASSY